jgi:hypothetical protein
MSRLDILISVIRDAICPVSYAGCMSQIRARSWAFGTSRCPVSCVGYMSQINPRTWAFSTSRLSHHLNHLATTVTCSAHMYHSVSLSPRQGKSPRLLLPYNFSVHKPSSRGLSRANQSLPRLVVVPSGISSYPTPKFGASSASSRVPSKITLAERASHLICRPAQLYIQPSNLISTCMLSAAPAKGNLRIT